MSNGNVFERLWKLEANANKLVLDGNRDPEQLCELLQRFIETSGDLVTVDRTIRPSYPDWMKDVLYPELEAASPAQFNVSTLTQWLHDDQKTGVVTGNVIHEHLKSNNLLEGCASLRDLEEIQKKGINFFRRHFQGKAVFGWKSVVRNSCGGLGVPYLIEDDGRVVVDWDWLGNGWSSNGPALRFA